MKLNLLDVIALLVFYGAVLGLSLYKSRGAQSAAGFFLGGRSLNWWLIGISIVAANISTEQMVGMAGQAAGETGLAVSAWQLSGAVGIVLIAFTIMPKFIRAGIYTIPEFLEHRYNATARALMAVTTVIIYSAVLLTAVLYSGALTIQTIFGLDLRVGVWVLAAVAALYTTAGGLKAVAWADLIQGLALLVGGLTLFGLGLHACGGWDVFAAANSTRLHMVLPASHQTLPWTGVVSGMWIVILYYCGLNQFIVQRTLGARSVRDGQLGMIFAGALWVLVPVAVVMPGLISRMLYGEQLTRPDEAFPVLIRNLVPTGLRGFMLAAIAGAVVSSLASMMNSAATIFTLDVYRRLFDPDASQRRLVMVGRIVTISSVVCACILAPRLQDPRFGGVFNYIQNFQGYIWPGVAAAFLFGLLVPLAPPATGVVALVAGPLIYWVFQTFAPGLHFLVQVGLTFELVIGLMALCTFAKPLERPWQLPQTADDTGKPDRVVIASGLVVIAAALSYFVVFW